MSVHPSLSSKDKGKGKRSVLKRFERLKELQGKEKWKPGDSVFGLLKIKVLRWKAKKAKKTAEAEAPTAEAAASATGQKSSSAKQEASPKKK